MKGYLKRVAGILLTAILLCSCGNVQNGDKEQSQKDNKDLEIGICFDSFVIERWEKDRDVFVAKATSLGTKVNVQNANGNVEKQIEEIRYLIEKHVDCLVIIPIDSMALADVIKEAKQAGIPVVCYDRLISNVNADLYISFDNEKVGTMLGEAIADSGAENVVMICGPLTDANVPMVAEAFKKIMQDNNINIEDIYHCDGWKAEYGSAYVYDNMDEIRECDAIMCGNDDIANSVIKALSVGQLAGQIPVVGQDADLPACQNIVAGTQLMTVYKPVGKLANEAASLAVQLAKGQRVSTDSTINDGTYNIPYVAIEPIAVNSSNLDEVIIDGGFHTKEDVYLNAIVAAED